MYVSFFSIFDLMITFFATVHYDTREIAALSKAKRLQDESNFQVKKLINIEIGYLWSQFGNKFSIVCWGRLIDDFRFIGFLWSFVTFVFTFLTCKNSLTKSSQSERRKKGDMIRNVNKHKLFEEISFVFTDVWLDPKRTTIKYFVSQPTRKTNDDPFPKWK